MSLRQLLDAMALIGIPSVFACVVWMGKKLIQFGRDMRILMNAQQKQMRRTLMMDYHKYMDSGKITDEELDMWEEDYQAYHSLGENGIMDSRRVDLMELNRKQRAS